MNLPRVSPAVMLCAFPVSMTLFAGCTDAGSLSHRDDGKVAADMLVAADNPQLNRSNAIGAEADRLMRADPKLSRGAAYEQARKKVSESSSYVSNTTSSAEEAARRRKMEAQDKFEKDLAKSLKDEL